MKHTSWIKYSSLSILCLLFTQYLLAQGCSDAGFCSLAALKQPGGTKGKKNQLDLGTNIGIGEGRTFTVNPYVQYTGNLNEHISLSGKVTATYASGFLGRGAGLGDFFGLLTYTLHPAQKNNVRLLGGVKIPLSNAGTKATDGSVLPLDYQASLGTYDLILGASYTYQRQWEFNTGVQLPVIQKNNNTFLPTQYSDPRAKQFAPTNLFRRKPDALLRAAYNWQVTQRTVIKPSVLGLYHLGEDTFQAPDGNRYAINGSAGITINGGLAVSRQFANNSRLELIVATPFVAREVRADGLTRKATINIQYSILF
ncbi:hypothetical protein KTO58_15130 [Chitinophaga pendula]|uniref:hypothetical protein n=1 Tax=Chitinophaga TaxID=79328 RepID=UPI000BAF9116|nr:MULTISPECIES: hypothetical protein [Chitinophaga]ASZ11942.1 hypothetical protein CK934_13725 [Chitinophaga sp. MD30]UCJ05030.1 hypothetical protein KTO58_15130 [Chitinophaga pendula]